MSLVELLRHGEELTHVLDATVCLDTLLRLVDADDAGLVNDGLDHTGELSCVAPRRLDDIRELGKTASCLWANDPWLARTGRRRLEEGQTHLGRVGLDGTHTRRADTASGRVDHAQGTHVVAWVHDQLEVGDHIAYLRTIEEARATDYSVGHTRTQEHVLERTGLGIRTIEHSDIVVARTCVMQLLDLGADPAPLVALVCRLEELDLLAISTVGKQALSLAARVVPHHRVRGIEDVTKRAIVLLKLHDRSVWVVLAKAQDVLDVGATPTVDGLVIVTHDHEVAMLACK